MTTYTGSGLGLSIVKKMVKKMDGTICLESKENEGSTFIITIPFGIDHKAQAAAAGKEAVDKFEDLPSGSYDFIFMDIMMPVMDGLEATRRIRAMDKADAKTIPILAMTANAFQNDIKQSFEAGMNAHLMKPLDEKKLVEVIREVIQ